MSICHSFLESPEKYFLSKELVTNEPAATAPDWDYPLQSESTTCQANSCKLGKEAQIQSARPARQAIGCVRLQRPPVAARKAGGWQRHRPSRPPPGCRER